jgi:acyl carrier protein
MGLNDLTYVEVMLEAENEFNLEFADEDLERFANL